MRVTILGLGRMGHAVASRLLDKGYEVTVWNRTPGKGMDLVARGAREEGSVATAAEGSDVVLSVLSADDAVKDVYLGVAGAIDNVGPNTFLVDMSTVSPGTAKELAANVTGNRFLEAPIMGSPAATERGEARLLIGGPEVTVRRLEGLWGDLAAGYVYCGPAGSALTVKLMGNEVLVGSTLLLAQAIVTARRSGISDEVIRAVFGRSTLLGPAVLARFESLMGGERPVWWTVDLAAKDLRLAKQVAERVAVPAPLATAAESELERASSAGLGAEDMAAVVDLLQDAGNTAYQ